MVFMKVSEQPLCNKESHVKVVFQEFRHSISIEQQEKRNCAVVITMTLWNWKKQGSSSPYLHVVWCKLWYIVMHSL